MQVRVLGDLEVVVDDGPVDLGGPKPRALLALLVAADGHPVPVERLVDQMWGEDPPARVEASMQSYVARLRRVLEPGRDPRAPATVLRTHAGGYSLDVPSADLDARRFTELVREARAVAPHDAAAAVESLTSALSLWRGDAYAGSSSSVLAAESTRLEELRLGAVADLWELRLREGGHPEAVAALEQLVGRHPLQERFWALLALALYRSARQGDALAALRRARRHLDEELGVDPGPQLRDLEQAMLRQDPSLDAPTESPADPARDGQAGGGPSRVGQAGGGPSRGGPAVGVPSDEHAADDERESGAPPPTLPGREDALALIDEAVDAAANGRGRVVVVSGEAGIGKSRLAEIAAERARRHGVRTGRGAWDLEVAPPLAGWRRALGQLLGSRDLLAHDQGGRSGAGDAASVVFGQADAVVSALAGGPPGLVVLDDVQWGDTESLRLLRRLAPELAELPVVLLVTVRTPLRQVDDTVTETLAALARVDPLRIDLTGLDEAAVSQWLRTQSGRELEAHVAQCLLERTDGNPFHLGELLRLVVAEGSLGDPTAPAWRAVPSGVRDVVRQRVRALPEPAAELLTVAAVVGRGFDVTVLEAVSGDANTVPGGLESAQVMGLVDAEGPGRFRFTHALVRDAVYESVAAPARSRLHAQVATALESLHAGRVDDHAAELAEHYRLAGPAHVRSAWVMARHAAAAAGESAAYDEALRLAELTVALQADDPTVEASDRERALMALAFALNRVARPVESWDPAARAARSAMSRGDAATAAEALLTVTGSLVWGWRPNPQWDDDAIALWGDVLAAQDPAATVTRAKLTAALAYEHLYRPGSAGIGTRLADEAVAAVRRSGVHDADRMTVLRLAQAALLRPDLLHHRAAIADELVDLALRLGHPQALASALAVRAQDRGELGRLDQSWSDVVRSHELAERHHLSQNAMVAGWCTVVRHQLDGDWEAAERQIARNDAFEATMAMSGYGLSLCQLSTLRDRQGRLGELEPTLRSLRAHPGVAELHALAMVRQGRLGELRTLLGEWREQPHITFDYLWLVLTAMRAEVWSALGDRGAAQDLYDQLLPYADRLAISVPVAFHGSVPLSLGRLARTLGHADLARQHLEAANEVHRRLGLTPWVAITDEEIATLD
ncbi:BTAD domain-containing putative transcriptional regulator [Knoellia aerolata]|uniref:BTAD domain-containing putative transcriptional regulator n=1 Tax=Knoellia aerolata TaxID=442954 RepID=UPI0012EE8997|nr:BTAD domain-containing putative transcriptional regulator [Knoellia aerolata]